MKVQASCHITLRGRRWPVTSPNQGLVREMRQHGARSRDAVRSQVNIASIYANLRSQVNVLMGPRPRLRMYVGRDRRLEYAPIF